MAHAANDTVDQEARKASLARLVADGMAPFVAGRELGLTKGQTARAWHNIKRDLGAQAV